MKDQFKAAVREKMEESLPQYPSKGGYTVSWDLLQRKFECCGIDSYRDWKDVFQNSAIVPDSCCVGRQEEDCGRNFFRNTGVYQDGCLGKLSQEMKENLKTLGGMMDVNINLNISIGDLHIVNFDIFCSQVLPLESL